MSDEMGKLRGLLNERGIAWRDMSEYGKHRTLYHSRRGTVAVICGHDTYGGRYGLLEAWYPGEAHKGWLTADDVIRDFTPCKRHGLAVV